MARAGAPSSLLLQGQGAMETGVSSEEAGVRPVVESVLCVAPMGHSHVPTPGWHWWLLGAAAVPGSAGMSPPANGPAKAAAVLAEQRLKESNFNSQQLSDKERIRTSAGDRTAGAAGQEIKTDLNFTWMYYKARCSCLYLCGCDPVPRGPSLPIDLSQQFLFKYVLNKTLFKE